MTPPTASAKYVLLYDVLGFILEDCLLMALIMCIRNCLLLAFIVVLPRCNYGHDVMMTAN